MFNVGVSNAMDEVIKQLGGESQAIPGQASEPFNYQELDSLVIEQLLVNGIDIHPVVGLYNGTERSFLYSSDPQHEQKLEESPYRYNFHPAGVVSNNQFFIILSFPSAQLFLQRNLFLPHIFKRGQHDRNLYCGRGDHSDLAVTTHQGLLSPQFLYENRNMLLLRLLHQRIYRMCQCFHLSTPFIPV